MLKNIFSKFAHTPKLFLKNFSTIRLVTRQGEIDRSKNPDFNQNINWELAKVWVTPNTNSYINIMKPKKSSENEACITSTVGKISQLDFDRLAKRMGLIISKQENVYVQDGVYKGKKIRIVSSCSDDASTAASILEEVIQHKEPEIHLLYLTEDEQIGTSKKFVLYDAKQKVVLSNAKNLESIKQAFDSI
jgi:hypothetical protein